MAKTDEAHIAQFAEDIWGHRNTGKAAHPLIVELADAYLKLKKRLAKARELFVDYTDADPSFRESREWAGEYFDRETA